MTKAAKPAPRTMFAGTMFKNMLRMVARVPRGRVSTYGDIAFAAGYPGAARQVAWALHGCGADTPWQRIVGAGGNILLTGEHGFEQRLRLQSEGVSFIGMRVNMAAHRHSFFPEKSAKKTAKKISLKKSAKKKVAEKKVVRKKTSRAATQSAAAKKKGRTRRP